MGEKEKDRSDAEYILSGNEGEGLDEGTRKQKQIETELTLARKVMEAARAAGVGSFLEEAPRSVSSSDEPEMAAEVDKPTSRDVGYENPEKQKLLTEYAEVNQNFRMLAEVRFKLLALIPTLGGVAIFLLSSMQQSQPKLGYGLLFLISCLGFLATLGVTFYDQRNSQLYNMLIRRAGNLEAALELYSGQFLSRPARERRMFWFIRLGHDSGLALIYGAVLGAWFYPLTSILLGLTEVVPERQYLISLVIAAVMVALSLWSFFG